MKLVAQIKTRNGYQFTVIYIDGKFAERLKGRWTEDQLRGKYPQATEIKVYG